MHQQIDKSAFQLNRPQLGEGGTYHLEWQVPDDLTCFEGHFPGRPILPAVSILDLAIEIIETIVGSPIELKTVRSAKFLRVIIPGSRLKISLSYQGSDWTIQMKEEERKVAELNVIIEPEARTR